MPLVILEGPDGSGKSTLAARLLKGTGHPTLLIKRSGPPGNVETLKFQSDWIAEQGASKLNIIADRHPLISEAIYAPVVRKVGPARWSIRDVCRAMDGRDILLIYCRPHYAVMHVGARVEEQMDGVHENYRPLVEEYDRWMDYLEASEIAFHRYDYKQDGDSSSTVAIVKKFWEKRR